jgi:hypothetical protein
LAVPILIFLIAIVAGAAVAARWLPMLERDRVGTLAFWVTCGLAGVALALGAVHVYEVVRELNNLSGGDLGNAKPDVVATGLIDTLRDIGPVLGLGAAVYLLAPASTELEQAAPVADSE